MRSAHRDVEVWGHHLAGLADLVVIGHETRIHRRPRGTHSSAQLVGQGVQQGEVLAVLQASAAGHHDSGGHEGGQRGGGHGGVQLERLDGGRATRINFCLLESSGTNKQEL